MTRLYIDLETRSAAPLQSVGVHPYAVHPTTELTAFGYARGAEPVTVWLPPRSNATAADTAAVAASVQPGPATTIHPAGEPARPWLVGGNLPPELRAALLDPAVLIVAHNFGFERAMLLGPAGLRLLGAEVQEAIRPLERWSCTAARAAALGLPRALDGAAAAAGMSVRKDHEGRRVMLRTCKPDRNGAWIDDPATLIRLVAYCRPDVEAERELDLFLPPLSPSEHAVWLTTERINERGIAVDVHLLHAVTALIADAERDVNARLSATTGGAVQSVADHGALTRWLVTQGLDDAAEDGVGKAALAAMLERTDLDPVVRSVLLMRQHAGGSAAKKFRAVAARLSADGRLRGALVYAGASATGRWSSTGAQLQNMSRGGAIKGADPEHMIRDVLAGATLDELEMLYGPPLLVAADLVRPTFISSPSGRLHTPAVRTAEARPWLARGDYSQIEARVISWLAEAAWKLAAFRRYDTITGYDDKGKPLRAGPDLYKVAASGVYLCAVEVVTASQRQTGKVCELALGFQGGAGALQAMAKAYGTKIPRWIAPLGQRDAEPTEGTDEWIKRRWRAANPEIASTGYDSPPGLWKRLESAAIECMSRAPGAAVQCGRLSFRRNDRAMAMRLPSGRSLVYWTPCLATVRTPWGADKLTVFARGLNGVTRQWEEFSLYGGLLTENAVQATARDIMADALVRLEQQGCAPVLTVHDEAVCEVPRAMAATATEAAAVVEAAMLVLPAWADGLPVAADASAGFRYVKA